MTILTAIYSGEVDEKAPTPSPIMVLPPVIRPLLDEVTSCKTTPIASIVEAMKKTILRPK